MLKTVLTMGRIKTKQIKAVTAEAYEAYKEEFTTDFDKNKLLLNKIQDGESKKLRNVIAGYATRLKKRDIKLGM
jgi:small subunit ribosomal protein S17e